MMLACSKDGQPVWVTYHAVLSAEPQYCLADGTSLGPDDVDFTTVCREISEAAGGRDINKHNITRYASPIWESAGGFSLQEEVELETGSPRACKLPSQSSESPSKNIEVAPEGSLEPITNVEFAELKEIFSDCSIEMTDEALERLCRAEAERRPTKETPKPALFLECRDWGRSLHLDPYECPAYLLWVHATDVKKPREPADKSEVPTVRTERRMIYAGGKKIDLDW